VVDQWGGIWVLRCEVCQLCVELQELRALAALARSSRGAVEAAAQDALRKAIADIRNLLGLIAYCMSSGRRGAVQCSAVQCSAVQHNPAFARRGVHFDLQWWHSRLNAMHILHSFGILASTRCSL
jgi:hypothetical protein